MTTFKTEYDRYYQECLSLLSQTGSVEDLFRSANSIQGNDGDYRDVTLGKLARFLASQQNIPAAMRFCSAIVDSLERADSLLGVAKTLREHNRFESAKSFLDKAAESATACDRADDAAAVFLGIADALERLGEQKEASATLIHAIELASRLPQGFEAGKTLRGCARLLASWGRQKEALETAKMIQSPELQATTSEEVQGRGQWPVVPGTRID